MTEALNSIMNSMSNVVPVGSSDARTDNTLGYAANLTKENAGDVFARNDFVQDVYDYYYERDGKTFSSVDEAKDYFMEDRRWRNMNLVSIGRDLYDANTQDDQQSTRLARLQTTFDAMPDFYQDGGDGWKGFGTNALAVLADPINLVGFGSGGVAARTAAAGVIAGGGRKALTATGLKSLRGEASREALKAGIFKGAQYEAAASGVAEGVLDAGIQARNTELGLQDGYSLAQGATAVIGGAAIGGAMGGVLGGVAAKVKNPFTDGLNQTERGIQDGVATEQAKMDAEQAEVSDEYARLSAEEEAITPEQANSNVLKVIQEEVSKRTDASRASRVDDDGFDARIDSDKVDALDLSEEDYLDLAAQSARDLDDLANQARADAAVEKDLNKRNALNERSIKLRRSSENLTDKLRRYLNPEEVTSDELIEEIKLITDQSEKLKFLDSNQGISERGLTGSEPQRTGADGSGTVRNQTDAEVEANQTEANRFRLGDDAIDPSGDAQLAGFKGGETPSSIAPDQDGLTPSDAEFKDLLAVNESRAAEIDAEATQIQSTLAQARADFDNAGKLSGETDEISKILEDGKIAEDADPQIQTTLAGLAQQNGVELDASETIDSLIKKLVLQRAPKILEKEGLGQNVKDLEAKAEAIEAMRADNIRMKDVSQIDYAEQIAKRNQRAADEAAAQEVEAAGVKALEAEKAAQAEADARNPSVVFAGLKTKSDKMKYLTDLGVSAEDMQAFTKLDGRKNKAAQQEAFEKIWNKRIGEALVGQYAQELMGEDGPIDAFYNIDPIPAVSKAGENGRDRVAYDLLSAHLISMDWPSADLISAAHTAHTKLLNNKADLNDKVLDIMKNPLNGENGFYEAAASRFGAGYAEILNSYLVNDVKNDLPAREMAGPKKPFSISEQGSKPLGLPVAGKNTALPSGNFATEPNANRRRDGRAKYAAGLIADSVDDELTRMKERARKYAYLKGFSEEQAEATATKIYYDKLEQMLDNRSHFVARNTDALKGQIKKVAGQIKELKEARAAYNASLARMPKRFSSTLVSEDVTVQVVNDKGELVDLEKIRYQLESNNNASLEEKQISKDHFANLSRLREVKRRYSSVAKYNAVMKNNGSLPVGQLIMEAEKEILTLNDKIDKTIKIDTTKSGVRTTKIGAVENPLEGGDYMGKTQLRKGDGTYETTGKIQSILRGSNTKGFTGALYQSSKRRSADGTLEHRSAISTAMDQNQKDRIATGTMRRVQDAVEAERNKPRIAELEASIDKIEKLKSKIASAKKQLEKKPDSVIKFEKEEVTLYQLEDMYNAALGYARANVVKDAFIGPDSSVVGGMKAERTRLRTNTEQGMLGNQFEVEDRGKKILMVAFQQIRREMKDPKTSDDRVRLLQKMVRDMKRLAVKNKADGKPYDIRISERIVGFANRKEAAGRRAAEQYQREVEAGMYNYENSEYGADARRFDDDDAQLADSYADMHADRDMGNQQFEDGDVEAMFFGAELPPELKDQIKTAANNKKVAEVVRRDTLADYQELARRAHAGEINDQELLAAMANLQAEIKRRKTPAPKAQTVVGQNYKAVIHTTPSGIEIDINNDISYSRPEGSKVVTMKIGERKLGDAIENEDGSFSIMHPDGVSKLKFKSFGPMKRVLAQIFNKQIEEVQAASKGTRFAVKETAKGIPHVQVDPKQTATYGNDKVVPVSKGKPETPEIAIKPEVDASDPTTWSAVDFEDMPAGRALAVQFLEAGPKVKRRVIRIDNSKKPQTIREMVGASRDVPYVIGHVQAGTKSPAIAQETFFPMDAEDIFIDQTGAEIVGLDVPEGRRGIATNSQSRRKRENRASDLKTVSGKTLKMADDDRQYFAEQGVELDTVNSLLNYVETLETAPWQTEIATVAKLKKYSTNRAAAARILRANVPNGIKKPTTTLARANEKLRTMFDGYPSTEVQTAVDFMERVALMNGGVAPELRAGDGASFSPDANTITLSTGEQGVVRSTPMSVELVHEMGHWIYENMLDEGDKQKFWSSMEKYYDDNGDLDFKKLEGGLLDTNLSVNAASNPQEFFANQFLGFALQTDAIRTPGSSMMKVFEKVSQIGAEILNWLLGKKTFQVDSDLHAIFQKYMPQDVIDPETNLPKIQPSRFGHLEAVGREHGTSSETQMGAGIMKAAEFAGKQMRVLDERIRELHAAKRAHPRGLGDSMAMAIDLERIAKETYGEYGGPVNKPFHRKIPGRPDSGKPRLMMLDKTPYVREPIIQAQYAIHSFLKMLRAENADHRFAEMLSGMSAPDKAAQEAIVAEMSYAGQSRDTQQMYERMLSDSKSAYEGLDEAIVDHLHKLSTDLQIALQGALKEYTGVFQRTMPHTERKRLAIDEFTGVAYVETDSPKTAKFKLKNRKENRKQIALSEAVTEIVENMTQSGIDWRSVNEADILSAAHGRKQELITIAESRAALAQEISGQNANNLGAKAAAFNNLKREATHTSMDLKDVLKRLENGNETQQQLVEIFRGNDQAQKNKMLQMLVENPDLEDAQDLIIAARHYGAELADAPDAVSTEPLSSAVSQFTDSITYSRAHDKTTTQTVARDLFIKMLRKIKGAEDPSQELTDRDAVVNEYDLAVLNLDENALDFDEDVDVLPKGERWNTARDNMREMAKHIVAINKLREAYHAIPDGTSRMAMSDRYDASVNEHRKPLFDTLYNFTFLLQSRSDQKLIKSMNPQGVEAFKTRFSQMTTRDLTTTDGITIKGESKQANAALKSMIDEASQILDGIMFQPQSRAERKMETRRLAINDLHRTERDKHAILGMVRNDEGVPLVHPSVASKYANSYLATMGARLDNAVRDFLGISPKTDLRKTLRFNVSADSNVRGVTPTLNGRYGDGVYLTTAKNVDKDYDVMNVVQAADEAALASRLTDADKQELDFSVNSTIWIRDAIRDLNNKLNTSFDEKIHLQRLLKMERHHWDVIDEMTGGHMTDQKVFPAFARIRSPLDVTSNTKYSLNGETDGTMRHLILEMADKQVLDAEGVQAAVEMFDMSLTGREMYDAFTNDANGILHTLGKSKNGAASRLAFNKMLRDMGYDALHTDEGDVVFDASMVKGANSFEGTDALLFEGETFGGDLKLTGQVVEEMMVKGEGLENPDFVGVGREARRMGMPQPVLDVAQKIFKQRGIQEEDVQKISKWSSVKNFFRENSSLFRQLGANWFGDLIQPQNGVGTFEKHDALLARKLQPIVAKLNALPDAGNNVQRWSRRNRGLAMGALDVGQPASHKRIIQALRRGRGAVQKLDVAEREVALEIGKAFSDELTAMKALGIKVGDARKLGSDFYVPQVYDRENILSNPSRFRASLVEILKREQNKPDFDPNERSSMTELGEIADQVAKRLTRGYDPTTDGEVQQALSIPFASRVINIQPGDYEFMDEFLVQDLQGILAKYYDRTIRKRVMTEQFGVSGHAFNAYVDVAQAGDGFEKGVSILKGAYRAASPVSTESGMADVEEIDIPALRLTPKETDALVTKLKRLLGDPETNINNKQTAINLLIEAGGTEALTNVQYKKRVEAIVNANIDFANTQPSSATVAKMRQMMDVLNKKPIDGGTGQEARYKVSRMLKSFTSVSLLGFTTFTSLPDVALPLVRSGNMRAFAKTWAKYSTDPSYRAAAKNIGVGIDNLMHERMVQMAGDGNQKFANAFFNATLLTPWTNTMREVASLVGFESFKSEIDRAIRLGRQGKTESRGYKTAVRYLERYGLTGPNAEHDFLNPSSFRIDSLPKNEAIEMQVQMAMIRFTNESIFTPNPNDLPMWGQTPWGSMMFQLKSFPMLMMKLQGYIMDEFKQGNTAPAFYMLTAGVGAGALSVAVKDYVQMRGGEEERSAEVRKRKLTDSRAGLAKVLGVKEGDDLDAALGWYLDGLLAVGGLGLLGEMLYNTSAQLDNGKYGFVRTMSSVFGPQVGTAELAFNVAAGAGQVVSNQVNDEDSNAKIRAALRDVYGRIPVAGRVYGGPVGREAFVDKFGGEAKKPGRKKSQSKFGSSSFNSSQFGGSGFD